LEIRGYRARKVRGSSGDFVAIAKEIEQKLEEKKGKKLVLNIDGAIAVVLCAFGWEPKLGKAVFLIARTPGLIGQYLNNS
jgi:citrate synthase